MGFEDSKYIQDEETRNLSSTIEFFPDMSRFEDLEEEPEHALLLPEWALKRIAILQTKLEVISNRRTHSNFGSSNIASFGSSLVFNLANEVFGFDGWSTQLIYCNKLSENIDNDNSKYSAKYSALVRVILKDGTYHEDYGTGEATNMPSRWMCYSKCKKQAVTDATKNAIIGCSYAFVDYEIQLKEMEHSMAG